MDTSKHTPGPWLFEGGCVETDGSPHSDRRTVIAQMISARHAGTIMAPGECEANGRLIAAAPDLLAALRELLSLTPLIAMPDDSGHADGIAAVIEDARAALAKAAGVQS